MPMSRSLLVAFVSCVSLLSWSCNDSPPLGGTQDGVVAADLALLDSAELDSGGLDTVAVDTAVPCAPGEGCFGQPCDETGDCLSGLWRPLAYSIPEWKPYAD